MGKKHRETRDKEGGRERERRGQEEGGGGGGRERERRRKVDYIHLSCTCSIQTHSGRSGRQATTRLKRRFSCLKW